MAAGFSPVEERCANEINLRSKFPVVQRNLCSVLEDHLELSQGLWRRRISGPFLSLLLPLYTNVDVPSTVRTGGKSEGKRRRHTTPPPLSSSAARRVERVVRE